jgi:DNA polymerase III delta subunit
MPSNYLVLSPLESERKKIIVKILSRIENPLVFSHEIGKVSVEEALRQLNTFDLFTQATVLILERCESLKKEERTSLQAYLDKPYPHAILIMSGDFLKPGLVAKDLISFDYSNEKPWQKERRMRQWLIEEAQKERKQLSEKAIRRLLESADGDFLKLEEEFFKLLCFVGAHSTIEEEHAQKILCSSSSLTGWQIAEYLIWGEGDIQDALFDLSYVNQMRYYLQLGEEISSWVEKGLSSQEIIRTLSHHKAHIIEKYIARAEQRGQGFFQRGLQALFELELSCKNSPVAHLYFWTRFQAQLKECR